MTSQARSVMLVDASLPEGVTMVVRNGRRPAPALVDDAESELRWLLGAVASIKRHDPNRGRDGYVSKFLTMNVPVALLSRIDAALSSVSRDGSEYGRTTTGDSAAKKGQNT